jgi:hypothetical protein
MDEIELALDRWKVSLCADVSCGGMLARNPIAHKWQATYRSLVLRETVFWRTHDLLTQSHLLFKARHILGSRILIRSALESVAALIYLNQLTAKVLDGSLDFYDFDQRTRVLLLGSRNGSTKHSSINIATVLAQCEKKYPKISSIYATLSECAHPNYEGVCFGYSEIDYEHHVTRFSNKWEELWADRHVSLVKLVCMVFEEEYNNVWASQLEALEAWLTDHDAQLEAKRSGGA